jgi:hypothetical protein
MTSQCFEYKGHKVTVVVDEGENERWGWSYSIDAGAFTPSRTRTLPGAVEAVEKATRHSRRRIDGLAGTGQPALSKADTPGLDTTTN